MILVVTDQLTLRFVLLHQGRFLQTARTATEALQILRAQPVNLQGVVLDERLPNSRLVSGFVRNHVPGVQLVSWQVAQRSSPFRMIAAADEGKVVALRPEVDPLRYIWDRKAAK